MIRDAVYHFDFTIYHSYNSGDTAQPTTHGYGAVPAGKQGGTFYDVGGGPNWPKSNMI